MFTIVLPKSKGRWSFQNLLPVASGESVVARENRTEPNAIRTMCPECDRPVDDADGERGEGGGEHTFTDQLA